MPLMENMYFLLCFLNNTPLYFYEFKRIDVSCKYASLARWGIKEHVKHSTIQERTVSRFWHTIRHVKKHKKKRNVKKNTWSPKQSFKIRAIAGNINDFIIACACAIPVLLQLSESSFEGLKCMVYILPMNIRQPCHLCPFWFISLIIHYSFTRHCIFTSNPFLV